ncbi:PAS domain-containing protein [Variovorax sp. J22R133]|uniref:hybrid sensor histidine kinase/response regulator n=1 Tax=Variovorax brevis TaxID=3053503 RepID=UPI00257493F2|nr:PAS domain-containing sensor histidine kinase [Variovorax sp. J22R133]MDM0116554.1 PAS domain-containing protein [Variovorax sp. J22R133]
MNSNDNRAGLTFLREGGEMGAHLRSHDGASTPLGPPANWPQGLRTAVRLMLNARHPVCIFWGAEAIFLCNDAYAHSIGATRRVDATGLSGRDACGSRWNAIAPQVERVMQGHEPIPQGSQWMPVSRDGVQQDSWWTVTAGPIDDASAPQGIGGVLFQYTETTELLMAQRNLVQSEERLHSALTGGRGIGTWDWDIPNDRLFADERVARLYGVDPGKAAAGAPIGEFFHAVHPDDVARVRANIFTAMQTGEPFYEEYRLLRPDGREVWVVAEGRCEMDADGKPLRFPGESFDVTRRKAVEARLQRLNAEIERKVIEHAQARGRAWEISPALLGTVNHQGYFQTSNPAWQAILGWSPQEVASVSIIELIHPDDVERSRVEFGRTRQGLRISQFPNRIRCKDGRYRWISWVGVPEDGVVYCSGRDITLEKERAGSLEDALPGPDGEEDAAAPPDVAHHFDSLLAGIGGSLQLIQSRTARGELAPIDRYVTAALDAVKRAATLSHRHLGLARRRAPDRQPTPVHRVVSDMEEMVRQTMGPDVHVEVIGEGDGWSAHIDPDQLEEALLILCHNARDAMPGGGRLDIGTRNQWLDQEAAAACDLPAGPFVVLSVTDTGKGMTPEVLAHVFEPFFTTKPSGQGTGIGLPMVDSFVRQSGGRVCVDSAPGRGTTVRLCLPRLEEHADAGNGQPDRCGEGKVVLLIDGEPTVRMCIGEALADAGYRILEAVDGFAGLKLLKSTQQVDLLIVDPGLPGGMSGLQLAQAARSVRPGLKVLFATGHEESAAVGNSAADGGMAWLGSPFDLHVLARKVRDMLKAA